jgi:hypothetical protein
MMSRFMLRLLLGLILVVAAATGCHPNKTPELRVLGVHDAPASHVFVQVTNPASRPMRLTKLEYTFASTRGTMVARGELPLEREIPAGAVAVLQVPLDRDALSGEDSDEMLTLRGRLTAELDHMVRTFRLAADIQPP